MKGREKPFTPVLMVAALFLPGLLAAGPLVAEEIEMSYGILELEEQSEVVRVRVSLTALNLTSEELANVSARGAGGAFLAERVVQFQAIPAGEARVAEATFVVRAAEFSSDWVIPLRIEFDDATGNGQERHLLVRSEEAGS